MKTTSKKNSGFTLVELAIVLVIIGLIIGGVLVGQDLIKAATIRSTVSDIEKFNAGATAFRGKYNGLPGDLTAARAVEFTLSPAATNNASGATGYRDGNGVIEAGGAGLALIGGENALFWQDLGTSGLIAGTYPGVSTTINGSLPAITAANMGTFLPHAKLRDTASYFVYSNAGRNFFYLGTLAQTAAGAALTSTAGVTPLEAKGIDEKIDDGAPLTGVVVSVNAASGTTGAALSVVDTGTTKTATTCMDGTATPKTYNSDPANNGGINCLLQLRTAF